MRLLHDMARCHDKECEKKETCLRWLCRTPEHCGPRTPHVDTMHEGQIDGCHSYIPSKGSGEEE